MLIRKRDNMKINHLLLSIFIFCGSLSYGQNNPITNKISEYVSLFNEQDDEAVVNLIPNKDSYDWIARNVPLFECPDTDIERTYYFRWWSYRKHIKGTPDGTIVTEFIEPVKHAARHNAISCALGHHIYEGRWLRDNAFLKEYVDFWLYKADVGESRPRFHQFSSWLPDALMAYHKVVPIEEYLTSRLDDLDKDYEKWEETRQLDNGLFWQHDVKDGMEESVSGGRREENMRPTINSYMVANARSLSQIAAWAGNTALVDKYDKKSAEIRTKLLDSLWDKEDQFFKTRLETGELHPAREAIGFIPWYFHIPDDKKSHAVAWNQVIDTAGFDAPWGLTTAERREPTFRTRGSGHGCEWDGPIWPFATSQTLRGMANLLADYKHHARVNKSHFYDHVQQYAKSHVMDGKPYIGEYQDEKTGYWLKGDHPRSKFYNHSTYADLIIQDLIGVKPQLDHVLELKPLIPEGKWDYFALTNLHYQGREIAIYWDKRGDRYNKGKGLSVFVDGQKMGHSKKLKNIKVDLN